MSELTSMAESEIEKNKSKIESCLRGLSPEELQEQSDAVAELLTRAREAASAQGVTERYSRNRNYRRMNENFFSTENIGNMIGTVGLTGVLGSTIAGIYGICMSWTDQPAGVNTSGLSGDSFQTMAGYAFICLLCSAVLTGIGSQLGGWFDSKR